MVKKLFKPTFDSFDPLKAKQTTDSEVAIKALKRELTNILDSYVGWYDPFCELIQNALDSLDEKATTAKEGFRPTLRIIIDIPDNSIIVSDNGLGLTKEKYEQFLAPSVSFKPRGSRGHKGVGATYLAYGFNHIQISTKTKDFKASGVMKGARKWLSDENPAGNPKVLPDTHGPADKQFDDFDSGVSIYIKFDTSTHPGALNWLKAETATQWKKILATKTGLGAIIKDKRIHFILNVRGSGAKLTEHEEAGIEYYWPHNLATKTQKLTALKAEQDRLYKKDGKDFKMPSTMMNLEAIHDDFDAEALKGNIAALDESELSIIDKFMPRVYFCYMYTAKVWTYANETMQIRASAEIFKPGIQLAVNNMPHGEIFEVPLLRNIGRQNQVSFIMHFENCRSDLGRKGFQKEIIDFSKSIARKIIEKVVDPFRYALRPITGAREDLSRERAIDDWKDEMTQHEKDFPLQVNNENFFLPTKELSITSVPTREQDVIALFNQLIAGGVIRGIRLLSTNEKFTYDGMFRVVIAKPTEHHIFNERTNPLGILREICDGAIKGVDRFESKPKIMEYKYSLDALVEDINTGYKSAKDIGLAVVWEAGEDYQSNYHILSLLDPDNLWERQYHGITHVMTNITSGQREMDLIVLKDMIEFLNDPKCAIERQRKQYIAA